MDLQLSPDTQLLVNDNVVWIGYGTLVGLWAKAVMPGRDPGGAIATLAMGIAGVVIGCGVWSLVTDGNRGKSDQSGGFRVWNVGGVRHFVVLSNPRRILVSGCRSAPSNSTQRGTQTPLSHGGLLRLMGR